MRVRPALVSVIILLSAAAGVTAQTAPDAAALTRLLDEFLAGASRDDARIHDRFWASELVYTGSSGRRMGKKDILDDVRSSPAPPPGGPATLYSAEDVRIQQYGDMAVLAFRLVRTVGHGATAQVTRYLNTGTLLKRGGQWQAVSWQATRMARPEDEDRKQVADAEAGFQRAVRAGDVKTLESVLDKGFVWTHGSGERMTRQQLVDDLAAGQLKYSKLDTSDTSVSLHGDAAVVRGVSRGQRSSFRGQPSGDPAPFTVFYTVTFANQGDGWKAVAMHSSRPPGD